ncbi:MAG TPA: hypothetical protein VFK48_07255 [Usitatibacter sp.]|nr:hypothetical protein [Usitatibacter sp.]
MTGRLAGSDAAGAAEITLECTGSPTCTGSYTAVLNEYKCSNRITLSGALVITNLDLSRPGSLRGSMTLADSRFDMIVTNGFCSIRAGSNFDAVAPYEATFDGRRGAFTSVIFPEDAFLLTGTFEVTSGPVFRMSVSGSIDAVAGNVRADIEFRPQDIGTTQSVFVFALAPASVVRPAADPGPPLGIMAKGSKAGETLPVGCVLAQLTSTGQLQQVNASQMQAFLTTTLTSQGLAITVLNGVPTVQIAGATFYIGYGASAASMIANGVNRGVATAPGAVQCKPERPQTGWWWAPTESGRGFSIEVSGNTMFFASYMYDVSGRSTWYAAVLPISLEGSYFTGTLFNKSGGQALDGAYRAPGAAAAAGGVTLAFNNATQGTFVGPGGSVAIERFNIVANGVNASPQANRPEGGWWWNPQEDGRGYFIEWQGGSAFIAGYMYDTAGNPTWYAALGPTPNAQQFQGSWFQLANGQTLAGSYRAPTGPTNVAPVTIVFQGAESGLMTLPGGRTTAITRFRF